MNYFSQGLLKFIVSENNWVYTSLSVTNSSHQLQVSKLHHVLATFVQEKETLSKWTATLRLGEKWRPRLDLKITGVKKECIAKKRKQQQVIERKRTSNAESVTPSWPPPPFQAAKFYWIQACSSAAVPRTASRGCRRPPTDGSWSCARCPLRWRSRCRPSRARWTAWRSRAWVASPRAVWWRSERRFVVGCRMTERYCGCGGEDDINLYDEFTRVTVLELKPGKFKAVSLSF